MEPYKIIEKTIGVYSIYKKIGERNGINLLMLIAEYDSYDKARNHIKKLLTPHTATEY